MCLLTAGFEDIKDIKDITDEELLKIRNLNEEGVIEVRAAIENYYAEKYEVVRKSMNELELIVRSNKCLKQAGINAAVDLFKKKRIEEISYIRNCRRKTLEEILVQLKQIENALND